MSKEENNIGFEYKNEYWLEAKKLLEKEEKKRRFFFWLIGMSCFAFIMIIGIYLYEPSLSQIKNESASIPNKNGKDMATISSNPSSTSTNLKGKKNTTYTASNIDKDKQSTTLISPSNLVKEKKNTSLVSAKNKGVTKKSNVAIALINDETKIKSKGNASQYISPISVELNSNLAALHVNSKTNLNALTNNFTVKAINDHRDLNKLKGHFYLVAAFQTHKRFMQEEVNKSNYLSSRFGFGYQKFIKKNVFFNAGLQFSNYQNLHYSASSNSNTDQIQNLNLSSISSNGNGNGVSVLLTNVSINVSSNVYTIGGETYFGYQYVTRKSINTEEIINAGSIAVPINFGVKVNRFSFQMGLTEEFLLFNKTHQKNIMYIENTALSYSESYSYNNFSYSARWLSSANFGLDYQLNEHFSLGYELKQVLHNKYKNKTQNTFLIKYLF